MLLVLERCCRDRSYCWHSNAAIAAMGGWSPYQARSILYELRDAGYLFLEPIEAGRKGTGRAGIFLHRRLNPDLPVEDRPPPPEAVARLWAARSRSVHLGGNPTAPAREIPQPPMGEIPQQNQDGFPDQDELNNHGVVVEDPCVEEKTPEEIPPSEADPEPSEGLPSVAPTDSPPVPMASPEGNLGLVTARATKRFGDASAAKVVDAVREYGQELVSVAVFGLPRLESWRGVLGALANWRRGPDGPTREEIDAARKSMAASGPVTYYRTPAWSEQDRDEAKAGGAWLKEFMKQHRAAAVPA
jgi:hypothetical protein